MRRTSILLVFACALGLGVAVQPAAAQRRMTDEQIQQLIREAAARAGVTDVPAPVSPSLGGGVLADAAPGASRNGSRDVTLGLDEAIRMALSKNLDIAVQRLNPQTYDYQIGGLRSAYQPLLVSQLSRQSQTTPSTQTISGSSAGTGIIAGTTTYNGGITQAMPWLGGALALTANNNRQTTTSRTALFDPAFNANWSAQLTQPLLRNLWIDNTRQQLSITALNQDISELQLQATVINTVSNVRNAYWDYVFAVQNVDVAKRSVALAEQLVRDNQNRVEIGTMAPMDVVQAQAAAATARQNLAVATGTLRTNELALKRLIVSGTEDPIWNATVDPTDRPEFAPITIDIAQGVKNALSARTDIEQVRKNLSVNDVTLKYMKNQALPQVDLQARYQLVGQGGTQYITSGSGINQTRTDSIVSGYNGALNTLWARDYPTWSVSLNVTYPVGGSQQSANVERAKLQVKQVEAQLRQIELQVATDVTNAGIQVQNTIQRVQATQAARALAQSQLAAEQSKFDVGMSTNYFIVQSQRDLATAQTNELQAILAYRKAVVEFERLQQTSLQNSNITILGR
jgi:outer membrane protein TolC